MKATAEKSYRDTNDFYTTILAPRHHRGEIRFGILDGVMLTVLIVEVGALMRMFLAN